MGNVVGFPSAQARQMRANVETLIDTRARHERTAEGRASLRELFIPATEAESDRFFQTKLGLIEFHAAEGARRVPYDVDLAALTVTMPHVHRALRAAKVRPIEVRACIDGPPLGDFTLNEKFPAMKGHHMRLRFGSADDKERFARQFGALETAHT